MWQIWDFQDQRAQRGKMYCKLIFKSPRFSYLVLISPILCLNPSSLLLFPAFLFISQHPSLGYHPHLNYNKCETLIKIGASKFSTLAQILVLCLFKCNTTPTGRRGGRGGGWETGRGGETGRGALATRRRQIWLIFEYKHLHTQDSCVFMPGFLWIEERPGRLGGAALISGCIKNSYKETFIVI